MTVAEPVAPDELYNPELSTEPTPVEDQVNPGGCDNGVTLGGRTGGFYVDCDGHRGQGDHQEQCEHCPCEDRHLRTLWSTHADESHVW